jgi:hypothetical protein
MLTQNVRRELSLTAGFDPTAHDLSGIPLPRTREARDRWLTAEEIAHPRAVTAARAMRRHASSSEPRQLCRNPLGEDQRHGHGGSEK